MNWAQENKFLSGLVLVMVIGVGALGYKVYSASAALEEADTRYTAKAARYNTLRRLAPFPNRQNLAVFEQQKKEAAEVITAFQAELAKKEFPVEPMDPFLFQDRLKKTVTEIRAKAAATGVKLPDKFYLGFDRYETAPPDKDATAVLGRQLKAIEWTLNQFISAPITELRTLNRPALPEEGGKIAGAGNRPAGAAVRPGAGDRGARGGRPELVTSHHFDIVVVCKQRQFANVLSTIISPKAPQFFIPRSIRVSNTNQTGPQRVVEVAPVAAVPDPNAPSPAANAPAAPPEIAKVTGDINYIVGEELIEIGLRLEIVDFAEPAGAAAK
jgi:hypothetical protein